MSQFYSLHESLRTVASYNYDNDYYQDNNNPYFSILAVNTSTSNSCSDCVYIAAVDRWDLAFYSLLYGVPLLFSFLVAIILKIYH
jgi:hypothetical protein